MSDIVDGPTNKVNKFYQEHIKNKKRLFIMRFKRLNERISVAKYPKNNEPGMLILIIY